LGAGEWLRNRVGNHELRGDLLDGNAFGMDQLSIVVILYVNMFGARVSVRVLRKCERALMIAMNDQRAPKLDTKILQ